MFFISNFRQSGGSITSYVYLYLPPGYKFPPYLYFCQKYITLRFLQSTCKKSVLFITLVSLKWFFTSAIYIYERLWFYVNILHYDNFPQCAVLIPKPGRRFGDEVVVDVVSILANVLAPSRQLPRSRITRRL